MSTYVINPNVEQEKLITAFLEEQHIPFFKDEEEVPDFVLDGIAKSREDVKAGRVFTFDEFKQRFTNAK